MSSLFHHSLHHISVLNIQLHHALLTFLILTRALMNTWRPTKDCREPNATSSIAYLHGNQMGENTCNWIQLSHICHFKRNWYCVERHKLIRTDVSVRRGDSGSSRRCAIVQLIITAENKRGCVGCVPIHITAVAVWPNQADTVVESRGFSWNKT
jgi:hypothetical protein